MQGWAEGIVSVGGVAASLVAVANGAKLIALRSRTRRRLRQLDEELADEVDEGRRNLLQDARDELAGVSYACSLVPSSTYVVPVIVFGAAALYAGYAVANLRSAESEGWGPAFHWFLLAVACAFSLVESATMTRVFLTRVRVAAEHYGGGPIIDPRTRIVSLPECRQEWGAVILAAAASVLAGVGVGILIA